MTFWMLYRARLGFLRDWQLFLEKYPVLICPNSSEPPFPDLLDLKDFPRVIKAQLTQVGLPLMGIPGLSIFTGYIESLMARYQWALNLWARASERIFSFLLPKRLRSAAPRLKLQNPNWPKGSMRRSLPTKKIFLSLVKQGSFES